MGWTTLLIGAGVIPDATAAFVVFSVAGFVTQVMATLAIGWLAAGRHRVRSWPRSVVRAICAWMLMGVVFGGALLGITGAVEFDWPVGVLVVIGVVALVALATSIMVFAAVGPFSAPTTPPATLESGQRLVRASVTAVAGSHRTFCVADFEYEGPHGGMRPASTISGSWLFPGVSSGVMLCDSADRPIRFYDQARAHA